MDDKEFTTHNERIGIPLPEDLNLRATGLSFVCRREGTKITTKREENLILFDVDNPYDGDSIAINVTGKEENGRTQSYLYLFVYSSLNGWEQAKGFGAFNLNDI